MYFLRLLSYLPFSALYIIADILFFFSFYIIKYRRDVVWKNLSNSFPDKSNKELKIIEKKFFKNLANTSVETLKLLTISEKELLKRVHVDKSLTMKLRELGYAVFGMTAHFNNWEWLLVASSNELGLEVHAVYQKLRSPFFNGLMKQIRGRFGVILHEKNEVVRDIYKMGNKSYLMSMVADQRPYTGENKYWSVFMNQDAAFYTGTETLARRLDIKVIYARMKRIKRGYYRVWFEVVESNPLDSRPHEITNRYLQLVEEDIRSDPSSYLWTHDRWKHKKITKERQPHLVQL